MLTIIAMPDINALVITNGTYTLRLAAAHPPHCPRDTFWKIGEIPVAL